MVEPGVGCCVRVPSLPLHPDRHAGAAPAREARGRDLMRRWTVTLLAAFVALVTIAPLLWMVSVSFMAPGEAARVPPPLLPENATLENYRQLFGTYGALRFLANSLLVSTLPPTLPLPLTLPAGHAIG